MMFNDKFETVVSDGQPSEDIDNIYTSLFAGSCECCVKEEYNQSGVLVYEPLLLYEVWLSEPEKHDQLDVLKR